MSPAIITNPRGGKIGYRLEPNRAETLFLEPGPNEFSVAEAKAIWAGKLTASGKVGLPRKARTMTLGEWLSALGCTVAWPEPEDEPKRPAEGERKAR